jgi:hypothetical protein
VVAVQSGSDCILPVCQHVDKLIQKPDPHHNCTGKAGDPLTSLCKDEIPCTRKIGYAIVIRPERTSPGRQTSIKIHDYPY